MTLDTQVQVYLERLASLNLPPFHTNTPEQMRAGMRAQLAQLGAPEPVANVAECVVSSATGNIPLRIYTPEGNSPFPLLVFFHGGGFVLGDLDTHDGICRRLANRANCIVISVAYPLAPEHKFPAAPQACYAATQWIARHAAEFNGDASRIALGGDSAGGNLTAVVAQMARNQGGPALIFQLMIYPDVDFRRQTPSAIAYEGKFGNLTREGQNWLKNHYLNNKEEEENPLASPLLAVDLRGLPPALILTAEYDTLRDEGERYGQRLKEAGVPVTVTRYHGMVHEFIRQPFAQSKQALDECSAALLAAFARVPGSSR